MQYPKSLKIRNKIYSLEFTDSIAEAGIWTVGDGVSKIQVSVFQTEKEKLKTVIHEVLHAIDHEYKVKIPHGLIFSLEAPLTRFINDNMVWRFKKNVKRKKIKPK